MTFLATRVQIVTPGRHGFAPLEALRQRPYLCVLRLPLGYALVVGRPL